MNWSAALHESNCTTWSNHLSTKWHHCIFLFLQGAPLKTSLVKITATWWKHLSTRWHHCIYYSFRHIHVDLMHVLFPLPPPPGGDVGTLWAIYGKTWLIYTHNMPHTLVSLHQAYTSISAFGGDFYRCFASFFIWHYRILYLISSAFNMPCLCWELHLNIVLYM